MSGGFLIVNADDWGGDRAITDSILQCTSRGAVSSVSAMVFMEDAERAAGLARERGIDAGLHLNLTTPFTEPGCRRSLMEHQRKIARYLRSHACAQVVYNPRLSRSFEYVVECQLDEFRRLYGTDPEHLDGHHHMHLCANVQFQHLLPRDTFVRRNFSFQPGEKSIWNRVYRRFVDSRLARRHHLADFLFSLTPLDAGRLQRIFALARQFVVELETHPAWPAEYRFLQQEIFRYARGLRIVPPTLVPRRGQLTNGAVA